MDKRIQIGLIGGGMFGANHIETIRRDGRAEVRWVCDRHEPSLVAIQDKYEVVRGTTDYHKVLEDPEVDAVIVVTPPFTHAEIATDVLRAGKHLLIEKPMAVNRAEVQAIIAEKGKHPELVVLEGSCRHSRLQPKFDFVKAMIDAGKLGDVYHIHHNFLTPATFLDWNPKATWALDKKLAGGGPIFDWGEYDLSFHLGILGDKPELQKVEAFHMGNLRQSPGNVEQHAAAYLTFDTGLTYYYERGAGVHCEVGSETRIYGTKGGLKFSYLTWESPKIEYYFEDSDGKPEKEILEVDMSDHPESDNIPLIMHFIDCLQGKAGPRMPVELAAKHLDILMRILEA
ncbi:MAG TPA: Gfo/Idh/MocA family oxidoreductase [Bacillota bacterium]|nr:Gfo/Idh/MocA family oxidoreductase [Bacillota bacterium]